MYYKLILIILLLVLATAPAVLAGGNDNVARGLDTKLQDALSGISYREMLYNKSLQTRFTLSPDGITQLDDGLLGIALEVKVSSFGSNLLQCGLHLYVDANKVKLVLPHPDSGIYPDTQAMQGYFISDWHPLNDADATFKITSLNEFNSRLLIQSNSYPKGITHTLNIHNYEINLYPGISYFYFKPACDALSFDTLGNAHMWLNKTNDSLNLPIGSSKGNPLMFYKFTIPKRLTQSFEPVVKKLQALNEENAPNFASYIRKYRAILDAEKGFSIPK